MNKLFKISGAVALIAAAGVLTVNTIAFAQSADTTPGTGETPSLMQRAQERFRDGMRNRGENFNGVEIDKAAITATALGISVEELEAAKEAGTNPRELIAELGLDAETVQANIQAAMIAQIQASVENGTITQEQADQMIERVENGHGKRGKRGGRHGGRSSASPEVMAQALGITVEELEAAKEAGTSPSELIEELGLDAETVQANLQAAKIAEIQAKVADESITQEQADQMIERIENGEQRSGRRGGRFGGQRGGPQGDDSQQQRFRGISIFGNQDA